MKKNLLIIIGGLFLASCASMPKWTNVPTSHSECKKTICDYGIGESSINPLSLREETAQARGRAKVLEIIQSRMKSVLKDYRGPEGVLPEKAIRSVAEGSLSGVYMVDKYITNDGTVYTLMKLEPEKFKKIIETNQELSTQAKEFIRNRTDELLSE